MFSFVSYFAIIMLGYGSNMNENIIYTEDDKDFILYGDKVKDTKVRW